MNDNLYNGIKHYLETLEYPPNTTTALKKTITSQSRLYFMKGEQLYRRGSQTRLVVTKDQVNGIIWSEHQHPLAGHYKFKNTLDRIRRRYRISQKKWNMRIMISWLRYRLLNWWVVPFELVGDAFGFVGTAFYFVEDDFNFRAG
ncbi:hypothetical protein O0I10_013014 [Lichtheimia ornata]|uniref:Integrase zinc-binding domain-containing protein n=1 Tax=Lichtheimia ornata TaxID=688661 RepID=A0AAD7UQA8_9FUNG|nr:uncharacterized protein O0I10_013014 [Lichtheimia ornata]KAJ8651438.1 hypothetical protein O0I10_013014 [Lichtheimia ornata]